MNLKQSHEKCFRSFRAVYRKPQIHDPFRHGIFYAEIFYRIRRIRQGHFVFAAGYISQDGIDEPLQSTKAALCRNLAGFITYRTVRHCIHIQDLIGTHAEQTTDQRLHLTDRNRRETVQIIIQLQLSLYGTFRNSLDKCLISGIQVIVFIQHCFY